MNRDVTIPLVLWVCAAVCTHLVLAGGGTVMGKHYEDLEKIRGLSVEARAMARSTDVGFEYTIDSVPEAQTPPPSDETAKPEDKPDPTTASSAITQPKPPEVTQPKPAPKEPEKAKEPEKPKPKEPEKKDPPKVVVPPPDKKEPPPKLEPPKQEKRIAVQQHVKPDQQANPDAEFIGDQANKVDKDKQTVATQTSHDRNDKDPTPGGNHAGADKNPGNSQRTRIAESEEHAGRKDYAPGEKGHESQPQPGPVPQNPATTPAQAPPAAAPKAAQAPNAQPAAPTQAPSPAVVAPPSGPAGRTAAAPDVQAAPQGGWTFNYVRPGPPQSGNSKPGPGQPQSPQANNRTPPSAPKPAPIFGLNRGPAQPGQMNLNLTQSGMTAVVGQDQLRKMREADGERRKSEHKGSFTASNFERWRTAIENYVSTVKPGNQTALNTAAVPFATYLNAMHNRIHPIFADSFLGSLEDLPKTDALNNLKLVTHLEIVLTKDGHLRKMGVVKTSGQTRFDVAALDSVYRAQPFGPAPNAIVSPDGNVYLHWEFHRDEVFACSTMNARPFMLNVPAPTPDPDPPPANPTPNSPTRERNGPPPVNTPETQHGALPRREQSNTSG